jgi:hypothetical protein
MIKPHMFRNYSPKEYKSLIKSFEPGIYIDFFDAEEGQILKEDFRKILVKYALDKHMNDLFFMFLIVYRDCFIELTRVRLPNKKTTTRSKNFEIFINFLAVNRRKPFILKFKEQLSEDILRANAKALPSKKSTASSFDNSNPYLNNIYIDQQKNSKPQEPKVKPLIFDSQDLVINEWIINTILDAYNSGKFPITIGYQIAEGQILGDVESKTDGLHIATPKEAYEHDNEATIAVDTIINFTIPLLNYLNSKEVNIEKSSSFASFRQISVLIEFLILANFYRPKSVEPFKFGKSDPSKVDKEYIYNTFINRIKKIKHSKSSR